MTRPRTSAERARPLRGVATRLESVYGGALAPVAPRAEGQRTGLGLAYDPPMRPLLVCTLVLGCSSATGPALPAEQTEDYVGRDRQVTRETLRFRDPAEQARFDRVHGCFAARATDDSWRHYPLRQIGNFVQEDWCRGAHSPGCAGGSFRGDRGDEWYDVYTLYYERDWPEVFGLGVSAGRLPADGEWGVSFSYRRNGAQIVGKGVSVSFHRLEGPKIVQELHLGDTHVYEVEETRIEVAAPGTPDDELSRLIASPESFKMTALARIDALTVEVERQIAENLVRKCVYGPYVGDGIPPICAPTPLTDAERATALTAARRELGARRAAVTDHAAALHDLITRLMAFDRCW